ncbi:EscF/YscF/HrpA family type III secretion system needle major subunit [Ottowia thiooxydans]|uniref:EscF/YscF/HrpA family type III secretion system needle major subunit n=1 Tax=Ottowia thiooxydans TaxID=219182 RepID=UPI00041F3E87|nr:EscF/YscF/HrpA family type III secretion system needle major subunit [Ottowia thiooxydans]
MATSTSGINFSFLSETMGSVLTNAETALSSRVANMGPNPTQADLLEMQVGLQKWTMMIQLQSTLNKELGDALKGVIQKAS